MASNQKKYSIVLDGVNQLGQPLSKAGQAINQLEKNTTYANNELRKLDKTQKQIAQYQGLQQNLKSTESELKAAKVAMAGLRNEVYSTGVARKEDIKKLQKAELEVNKLNASLAKQRQQLGSVGRELKSAGVNVKSLSSEQLKLELRTNQTNRALQAQKQDLKELNAIKARQAARQEQRGQLMGEALGVAATTVPMVMAAGKAVNYESAYIDVQKATSFDTPEEEADFKRKMKNLAVQKGMDQVGMTEIVAAAGRSNANMTPEQLLQFADEASQMATAFDIDAKEAGTTLATFKASMGLEGESALNLAKTSNFLADSLANTEAKNIAAVMKRQGATALNAGFNEAQVAALAGSIFSADGDESTSATALKNITNALTAGYSATGAQQDAFERLGLNADDVAANMQSDAAGTLVEVLKALKDADDVDRSAIISQLFGKEIQGSVVKLVKTMDGEQGLINTLKKASDTAERDAKWQDELNRKKNSSQYSLDQLGSVFNRVIVAVGDGFLPILDAVTPAIVTFGNGLADLLESAPMVGVTLGTVATGLVAIKTATIGWKLAKNLLGSGKDLLGQHRLSQSTLQTKRSADRASSSLSRLNRNIDRLGQSGGYSGGGRGTRRSSQRQPRPRTRSRSKWGRLLGLTGIAGGLAAFPSLANASEIGGMALAGADTVDLLHGATGLLPKAGKVAGKLIRPLSFAMDAVDLAGAVRTGNATDIGGSIGDMSGGLGGMAAGAALGTMFLPGIGTAIGGALGSFAGSELGRWFGEKVAGLFSEDKTSLPPNSGDKALIAQVAKQSTQAIDQRKVDIHMNLAPTGNPAYDRQYASDVANQTALAFINMEPSNLNIAIDSSLGDTT